MTTETDKDSIEIELNDPAPVATDIIVEEPKAKEPEVKADPVDDSLVRLREQLDSERRARADAERKANEYAQTAHASRTEAQHANLHLLSGAIDKRKQDVEILKAHYSAAMANQDYESSAEIQMQMASVAAELQQLTQGKQASEAAPKAESPKLYVPDPVEAFASQLSPRSAEWVRAHPEYVTDPRKQQKMAAAHQLAMADGITADTDDYFAAVESTLRINPQPQETYSDATADAARVTQRRSSAPAAPVSRSGAAPGTNPRRVTLSSDEREMAQLMGMQPEEYARNKLSLQKEGKLH